MDPGSSSGSRHGGTSHGVVRGESFIISHEQGHTEYDFGGKTIGMFAGVALLINNITGPGVPGIPNIFAESGWFTPTLCFILIWCMSTVSASMYAEAMRRIPGNEHFRGRLEYTSIVDFYFGRVGYFASQIGLNGALQSLNIISVIQSAQVMDKAIAALFGRSCGLNISPFKTFIDTASDPDVAPHTMVPHSTDAWSCLDLDQLQGNVPNPWGCHVVITAGFVITLGMAIPCGLFNLDDNMIVQVVAFILTLMCWAIWVIAALYADPVDGWSLEAVNSNPVYGSQAGVLGNILFNFGFVTTVPSWINEKKPHVSVNKTLWLSTLLCNCVFFVIGIPAAMAFRDILAGPATNLCKAGVNDSSACFGDLMSVYLSNSPSANLNSIFDNHAASLVVQISVYLFPVVAIVSSIPVFSIVIKYNCIENGWRPTTSFLWGVVFPWAVSLPLLYQPGSLPSIINFTSLFFVSFTDFIVPWTLYIMMVRMDGRFGGTTRLKPVPEEDEEDVPPSGTAAINNDMVLSERSALLGRRSVHPAEHFAVPESWGLSDWHKIWICRVMVVVMTATCLYATILTIQQTSVASWACSAVGGS
eukprot:m.56106 g.56106  ORF g.56106 m.56106 type:complete len:587 (-) comp7652_c0_seq2:173-1933(-)